MLRLKIKQTKSSWLHFSIPENEDEITIGQLIALRKTPPEDMITILSILSGKPLDEWQAVPYNEASFRNIAALVIPTTDAINKYFSNDNVVNRFKKPAVITIGDENIAIPEDLYKHAYWSTRRAIMIIQEITEELKEGDTFDATSRIPELLAHYLYCPTFKCKYNEQRADEFITIINDLPINIAIPLGNFILLGLTPSYLTSRERLASMLMRTRSRLTYNLLRFLGR